MHQRSQLGLVRDGKNGKDAAMKMDLGEWPSERWRVDAP